MIKVLGFLDPHVMGRNPKYRKDSFPETIIRKMEEVGDIAKREEADLIVCAGDLFDNYDVSSSLVGHVGEIIKEYPCDTYGVLGNHDIIGYNPDTVYRCQIGILSRLGIYKGLDYKEPKRIEKGGVTLDITGFDSTAGLDNGTLHGYTPEKSSDADYLMHVVHGFIANKKWPKEVPHTLISDIAGNTKADVIFSGHEHSGYDIVEMGNTKFCNCGALGRIAASVGEVNRRVQVALFEFSESGVNIKLIPLDTAKDASEVLDRETLEKEKKRKQGFTEFVSVLENRVSEIRGQNREDGINISNKDMIIKVGEKMGLSERVVEKAIEELGAVQEETGLSVD